MDTVTPAIKRSALLVATLASFLTPFMGASINIAIPVIGKEFALNAILLNWVATSQLLASAMLLVPFGRIADIYGRKLLFILGIITYTLASLLCALSASGAILIIFRVIQGIGASMTFGTAGAILASVFPPGERGRVFGINVSAVYLGLTIGPFAGGILTEHFGWRSVFWANVPLGIFVILVALWQLKGEWAEARGEKLDVFGSCLFALSLFFLVYGMSRLPSFLGLVLLVLGIVGLFSFIGWEMKTQAPVFNVKLLLSNRIFAFSNLAALLHYSGTFAVGFLLSLYLQSVRGYSPQTAGLILIAQPVVMALFSPLAGMLSDFIEPRIVASIGMSLSVISLLLFSFLSSTISLSFIIAVLILIGFGFALFSSPNTNAIMSSVDNRFYALASGTIGTMRLIGMMLSMSLVMLIFALIIGKTEITVENAKDLIVSARIAFLLFSGLSLIGVFASLARGKMHGVNRNSNTL